MSANSIRDWSIQLVKPGIDHLFSSIILQKQPFKNLVVNRFKIDEPIGLLRFLQLASLFFHFKKKLERRIQIPNRKLELRAWQPWDNHRKRNGNRGWEWRWWREDDGHHRNCGLDGCKRHASTRLLCDGG